MGELRNLTEENVEELKVNLKRMQQDNPDLEYRFFQQNETDTLDIITINGHVLINSAFRKIPS